MRSLSSRQVKRLLRKTGACGSGIARLRPSRVVRQVPPKNQQRAPFEPPKEFNSRLRTWHRYHVRAFGPQVPVVPLTPEKLHAISTLLKDDGYRTIPNMLSAIRRHHVSQEFEISEVLRMVLGDCRRLGRRRIGAPRRARAFSWRAMASPSTQHPEFCRTLTI